MNKEKKVNVLFIGDVFGAPGVKCLQDNLKELIDKYDIDFVIAQSENVSSRKGLTQEDYLKMKEAGVNAFTLGNHVWAKKDILSIINNEDVIRPLNIQSSYAGHGTQVFALENDITIRVTSFMGITFNQLLAPWGEEYANNFFDVFDELEKYGQSSDFHIIDFHGETTSEKNVFGLYVDGKVHALLGTHTHVQTNDAHVLPNGTCYITDAGMCGPFNAAIGANFEEVYRKMRYGDYIKFKVSSNPVQLNGVVLQLSTNKQNNKIFPINIFPNNK
ncbi:MAG: TIGR00282 family metallophosphoesterase [Metamycoplasmataceae bacterium]|uniref:TIGR00282 family metallophosphoesterase n=1 Tax=Mycoplasmopsis lipophila TaxID=2117 RepID=UPI003872F5DE